MKVTNILKGVAFAILVPAVIVIVVAYYRQSFPPPPRVHNVPAVRR